METEIVDDLYTRVENWQIRFYKSAAQYSDAAHRRYYADAASGLAIALQEIDKERYERTSSQVWKDYQELLAAQ